METKITNMRSIIDTYNTNSLKDLFLFGKVVKSLLLYL